MNILSYTLAAAILLLKARPVATFGLSAARLRRPATRLLKASSLNIDYDRARECADSFGTCSVEDMERMKNGAFSS